LLADTRLTSEQREYVETIRNSTENLLSIINEILDFSNRSRQADAGSDRFRFAGRGGGYRRNARRTRPQEGVELACSMEQEVPERLQGDPVRFRQVLTNLVSNAVKFTEHGEVLVRVKKTDEKDDVVRVRFEVKDTGIGISSEAMSRIFTEFTQADGSTTRRYGGTGLGLTISKQIIQLMGGAIERRVPRARIDLLVRSALAKSTAAPQAAGSGRHVSRSPAAAGG
jgi:signal transduction histidine kinase